jgi:Protein of unknown function (DUF3443)
MAGKQRLCPSASLLVRGLQCALFFTLSACGGGSGASSATANSTAAYPPSVAKLSDANVVSILVQAGPGRNANIPYVSVTVCQPHTSQCKTIDNVMLDTGSTGLRLFASQLQAAPTLALPAHSVNGSSTVSECAQFLSMVAWGQVHLADVVMGGERAAAVPVQLMREDYASLPAACGSAPMVASASSANTQALHANGILGVGLFRNDAQLYFDCPSPSTACQFTPQKTQQVQNPVGLFPIDNNGVAIQLPGLPSQGVSLAQGYLIFGVGTQANNQLGRASVVPVDPHTGYFTTTYRGTALQNSFIDSGSNGLFFNDPVVSITRCGQGATGFYCPSSPQHLWASMALDTSSATILFTIDDAGQLFAPGNNLAFSNLGGPASDTFFDWGLPFFFGRTVFTVIEGSQVNTAGGARPGPLYAFVN